QEWGMQVTDTASPLHALELVAQGAAFDVAVLDYLMPEMDGAELAATLRARGGSHCPRLILLSSVRLAAAALPDLDLVRIKPLRRADLLDALLELLGQSAHGAAALAPRAAVTPATLRILLVEDNAFNQQVALQMLTSLGYTADLAANGLAAVEA